MKVKKKKSRVVFISEGMNEWINMTICFMSVWWPIKMEILQRRMGVRLVRVWGEKKNNNAENWNWKT